MRIQIKVVLLVLVVLVGTLSAIVWKIEDIVLDDKMASVTDASAKQIAPLRRLVQEKMGEEKERLVRFAAARTTLGTGNAKSFGHFDVVSLVHQSESGQWSPAWVEKGSDVEVESWPNGHEITLLKSLPYSKVRDGDTMWLRLSDGRGEPMYAVVLTVEVQTPGAKVEGTPGPSGQDVSMALPESTEYGSSGSLGSVRKAVLVGFTSANSLAAVSDDFIGSTSSVYIVDDRGFVASHINKSWIGANFTEDPIVETVMRTQKSAGTGEFDDINSRPVIGHFERIDRTNLVAIVTVPKEAVTGLADATTRVALMTGLSVGLIGLILAWLMGRGLASAPAKEPDAPFENSEMGELESQKDQIPEDKTEPAPALASEQNAGAVSEVSSSAEPRVEVEGTPVEESARATLEVWNEGLTSEMKDPLLAILGHAQLAKAKAQDNEIRLHTESIEREARRAKDVLERIQSFGAESKDPSENEKMNLRSVLEFVLHGQSESLAEDGIRIEQDLVDVPDTRGSSNQVAAALQNIFENAREAMQRRPERKLGVRLRYADDKILVSVSDSGVGMSRDVKEKVFDPFFKAFESPSRVGLGLTFVQAALKRLNAKCEIETTPGEGTTFHLKFPVTAVEKRVFENRLAPEPKSPEMVASLPPVEDDPIEAPAASTILAKPVGEGGPEFPPPPPPEEREPKARHKEQDSSEEESAGAGAVRDPMSLTHLNALKLAPNVVMIGESSEDDDDDDDLSVAPIEPPLGASVVRVSELPASVVDDDDDEDEVFANIPLNQAALGARRPLVPPPPPKSMSSERAAQSGADEESGFRVQIRRPKSKR